MTFAPSPSRTHRPIAIVLLGVALLAVAGCPTQKEILALPGLADVTPLGPRGKQCYEYCAQAEAGCKHMCPKYEGICQEDCRTDTKFCLRDCPELQRPEPRPKE